MNIDVIVLPLGAYYLIIHYRELQSCYEEQKKLLKEGRERYEK